MRFVTTDVDDPVKHVLSANLHRRHLTSSQKAMIGDKARELFDKRAKERQEAGQQAGGRGHKKLGGKSTTEFTSKARDEAGKAVGVSGSLIDRARTVREKGTPELSKAVGVSGKKKPPTQKSRRFRPQQVTQKIGEAIDRRLAKKLANREVFLFPNFLGKRRFGGRKATVSRQTKAS